MKYEYWLDHAVTSNEKKYALLCIFETAENIYRQNETGYKNLCGRIPDWREEDTERLLRLKREQEPERMWEELHRKGIRFVSRQEEHYPSKLKEIANPPYGIYYQGKLPGEGRSAAIVGARRCSEYGYYMGEKIAEALAACEIQVISGMAEGIDAAGHLGALQGGGETYGVLGCGVDICYPKKNQKLYEALIKHGGVISEFLPGTEPRPCFFPMRNRIISGLSDILIVVEAKRRSGALITADFALEQGREIYAVPGRATDALSYGCNNLIRQGAGIILSVEDLLMELAPEQKRKLKNNKNKKLCLAKEESLVYSCLSVEPKSMEQIITETSLEISTVAGALLRLQNQGIIRESFRNYYIEEK